MERIKKLSSQLGHRISEPGAHIAHAAVLILKKRRRKGDAKYLSTTVSPTAQQEHNPFPFQSDNG